MVAGLRTLRQHRGWIVLALVLLLVT